MDLPKGLIFRIYKETLQLNNKTNNSILRMGKEIDISPGKKYNWPTNI
jgi:hypothetical protein